MPTVYGVVRTIGEPTLEKCKESLCSLGFEFEVLENVKPLEMASKRTIQIGIQKQKEGFKWIMAVDADIILKLDQKTIENYCLQMEKTYGERLFGFTAYLDCTKRGFIDGMHFFRTKYCMNVYNYVKNKNYNYRVGREEYEICQTAKNELGYLVPRGLWEISFGTHIYKS